MTSIEWTDHTWNPIVGCSIVSPGCTNCYAMKMAARIEAMASSERAGFQPPHHYVGTTKKVNGNSVWTGKLALAPESTLLEPLRRKKPTMYFVNSMGDLFHEKVIWEWMIKVWAAMYLADQHIFQVLTKRADNMQRIVSGENFEREVKAAARVNAHHHGKTYTARPWPLSNIWLGVSTEDQKRADERIPLLLQTPAAVRFISAEPLLGPIDLDRIKREPDAEDRAMPGFADIASFHVSAVYGSRWIEMKPGNMWSREAGEVPSLDWVIVGGESGAGARPMHPQWARDLEAECRAAGVAYFFKQWGEWAPQFDECGGQHPAVKTSTEVHHFMRTEHFGTSVVRIGKANAGRLLDGKEHNAFPEARHA